MKSFTTIVMTFFLFCFACTRPDEYVIPCPLDTNFYHKEGGVTKEESIAFRKAHSEQVKLNTLRKKIPGLPVYTPDGETHSLAELIDAPCLLYSSDSHCGFGLEGLEEVLPQALEMLGNESIDFKVIILFERSKYDINNPERFEMYKEEFSKMYDHFFIIDDTNARKLNIWGCPTRMITTKHGVVTYMTSGLSYPERLYEELKEQLAIADRL